MKLSLATPVYYFTPRPVPANMEPFSGFGRNKADPDRLMRGVASQLTGDTELLERFGKNLPVGPALIGPGVRRAGATVVLSCGRGNVGAYNFAAQSTTKAGKNASR